MSGIEQYLRLEGAVQILANDLRTRHPIMDEAHYLYFDALLGEMNKDPRNVILNAIFTVYWSALWAVGQERGSVWWFPLVLYKHGWRTDEVVK